MKTRAGAHVDSHDGYDDHVGRVLTVLAVHYFGALEHTPLAFPKAVRMPWCRAVCTKVE